jgi:hypothetical protein
VIVDGVGDRGGALAELHDELVAGDLGAALAVHVDVLDGEHAVGVVARADAQRLVAGHRLAGLDEDLLADGELAVALDLQRDVDALREQRDRAGARRQR